MSEKIRPYSLIEHNKDSDSDWNPSNDSDNSTASPEVANHYDLLKSCSKEPSKTDQDGRIGRSRRARSFVASGNHKLEVTTTRFIQEGGDECTKKMIILLK